MINIRFQLVDHDDPKACILRWLCGARTTSRALALGARVEMSEDGYALLLFGPANSAWLPVIDDAGVGRVRD